MAGTAATASQSSSAPTRSPGDTGPSEDLATIGVADRVIEGVWVKAGNNGSGDGPGYGERFESDQDDCDGADGTAGDGGAGGTAGDGRAGGASGMGGGYGGAGETVVH